MPPRAEPRAAAPPRVFTVPPGRPFIDALARAVLDGNLPLSGGPPPSPIDLPAMTLLMPTRRAARALQEAFLRQSGGAAMLLPTIRPISEGEDELTLLTGLAGQMSLGPDAGEVPPAISELERRLTLVTLVLRWSA